MCCKECIQTEHYMRTLKSRNQNNNSNSKHTRFNYTCQKKGLLKIVKKWQQY
jgi:hypothetical protein